MIAFFVHDMTCGHCVGAITRAVAAVDPGARLQADLATHRVSIDPVGADTAMLAQAIRTAGYTPVAELPEPVAPATAGSAARRAGCGCGCG